MSDSEHHDHGSKQADQLKFHDYMEFLRCHRNAIEVRRADELKICTAAVVFLLVVTKGLSEAPDFLSSTCGLTATVAGFTILLSIYGFMLLMIEKANKHNRYSYNILEAALKERVPEFKQLGSSETIKEIAAETRGETIVRSWAAVPPFAAAVVVAILCLVFLFVVGTKPR